MAAEGPVVLQNDCENLCKCHRCLGRLRMPVAGLSLCSAHDALQSALLSCVPSQRHRRLERETLDCPQAASPASCQMTSFRLNSKDHATRHSSHESNVLLGSNVMRGSSHQINMMD